MGCLNTKPARHQVKVVPESSSGLPDVLQTRFVPASKVLPSASSNAALKGLPALDLAIAVTAVQQAIDQQLLLPSSYVCTAGATAVF